MDLEKRSVESRGAKRHRGSKVGLPGKKREGEASASCDNRGRYSGFFPARPLGEPIFRSGHFLRANRG
jgi:hypothetical protein